MATPNSTYDKSPGFLMKSAISTISLKFSAVKNISTSCLYDWLERPDERTLVLLDCRPEQEHVVSHIKDSIKAGYKSRGVEQLMEMCEEKLKDKPNGTIVCYCSVGYRSSEVAQELGKCYDTTGKQPRPEIFNLEGSLFKWAEEGRPMVDVNGDATKFVHPYSAVWGKLVSKDLRKESL